MYTSLFQHQACSINIHLRTSQNMLNSPPYQSLPLIPLSPFFLVKHAGFDINLPDMSYITYLSLIHVGNYIPLFDDDFLHSCTMGLYEATFTLSPFSRKLNRQAPCKILASYLFLGFPGFVTIISTIMESFDLYSTAFLYGIIADTAY